MNRHNRPTTVGMLHEMVTAANAQLAKTRASDWGHHLACLASVVTRTREQASQLSRQLLERGAEVLEIPTIKMEPPTDRHAVADVLAKYESIENLKMLLLRAEVATKELPKKLEELGAIVDDIACYKTVPETEDRAGAAARLLKEGADWITFASGSSVENFHARLNLNELLTRHPRLRLASIGPETSKAIVALGLQPAVESKEHTIEGLVKAIEKECAKASKL